MSFEKPFISGPAGVEKGAVPIEIPQRFELSSNPETREDLRYAIEFCDEQIAAEKYRQGRLPNVEMRYRRSVLHYLLNFEAIELNDLREALIEEYEEIKESAYQKALEFVYRLNRG